MASGVARAAPWRRRAEPPLPARCATPFPRRGRRGPARGGGLGAEPGEGPLGACTAQWGPVASRSELRPGHLFSTLRPSGQGGLVSRVRTAESGCGQGARGRPRFMSPGADSAWLPGPCPLHLLMWGEVLGGSGVEWGTPPASWQRPSTHRRRFREVGRGEVSQRPPHSLSWGLCPGAFPAPSSQRQRQTLRQGVGNREKPGVRGWRQTPRQVPGRGGERGLREGVHGGYGVSLGYLHKAFPNDLCLRPPTGRRSQQ